MRSELQCPHPDYRQWLADIKGRYRQVQLKAAMVVNTAVLEFYWELGADIVARQSNTSWGQGFLTQLSADLMNEFPGVSGFSKRNLEQMRRWVTFWSQLPAIAKQPASQLMGIPWWHHVVILTKCKEPDEALYYVLQTQAHGWSRSVLTHQIESGLWQREGRAITNFAQTLPAPHSDLARQLLKDPYVFDFLSLTPEHTERELETALNEQIAGSHGGGFPIKDHRISNISYQLSTRVVDRFCRDTNEVDDQVDVFARTNLQPESPLNDQRAKPEIVEVSREPCSESFTDFFLDLSRFGFRHRNEFAETALSEFLSEAFGHLLLSDVALEEALNDPVQSHPKNQVLWRCHGFDASPLVRHEAHADLCVIDDRR